MKKLLRKLASLRIAVVGLFLLMVLIVWGTLYQVDFGLYAAQQRIYGSWVFFVFGVVPFPGTMTVLSVLFVNLLAATLVRIRFGWRHSGVMLVHAGLLLLLAGGFVIHEYARESFLSLAEGEGANVSTSYQDWELAFWNGTEERHDVVAVDINGLDADESIRLDDPSVAFRIESYHPSAQAFTRAQGAPRDPDAPFSPAGIVELRDAPASKEAEENIPGAILALSIVGAPEQRYLLFGGDPRPAVLKVGDKTWNMTLRRRRFVLPAVLRLIDFRREMHPNSGIAKSYSSLVELESQAGPREVLIRMNEPLRFGGHTFYQASYSETRDGKQTSTLAVVKNAGRLLPYVASGLTFVGLVLHFLLTLNRRRTKPGGGTSA